jgi:hypothetical protein
MVNTFLNAVTKQLGTTFGNGYHYYLENVEQNLTTPCFTVDMLLPIQRSKSAILYDRTMPLVLHYFSDSETDIKKDCYEKAEQIVECLEYLPIGSAIVRGEDIRWEIVEDVLQVFLTYRYTTKLVKPEEDAMETFDGTVQHS